MGQRGPQPKPSALKHLEGTFRADRAAQNEAVAIGKPSCPGWMTDPDARREFRRLVKLLTAMGLVGAADQNVIVRYCLTWVRWKRVCQGLMTAPESEYAKYYDGNGNLKACQVSAVHSIARSLGDELAKCEAVLGLSPSARSRINVTMPAADEDDLGSFLNTPMRIAQ